jgi:branched-chain amino acid transport system ATP-binding protein
MTEKILEIENLSISFGGIKAVRGVNFEVGKGEILGLIGPNGAGKSTCVNLICNIYKPDTGVIKFEGKELSPKVGTAQRARMGITRTFQTPKPFGNLTVYENIFAIALQNRSFAEADNKTCDILEKTKLKPYKDFVSAKLPIEKRKFLDMARVLALDPKLIMMDEVMGGLNPSEMDESFEMIKRINSEGITILFIEHVMRAVVNVCTRLVVLNMGQVLCAGAPVEVLKRQDVIEAYLGESKNANHK